MKWSFIGAMCLYAIGVAFFVAFAVAQERIFRDPPGGVIDTNPIYWMFKVAFFCIAAGSSLLTGIVARLILRLWK